VLIHHLLQRAAAASPQRRAVEEEASAAITYAELSALADRLRDRLHAAGVRPGDRVGIYLRKSIDAVAAIFGALQAGAAYVPVDPDAPVARNAYILDDCSVRALVVEQRFVARLMSELGPRAAGLAWLVVEGTGGGLALRQLLDSLQAAQPAPAAAGAGDGGAPDDLAYILYTSGSTGRPKGVMLSHRNALSFVDWCSEAFAPRADERFSSHAPLHFDLSVLDLFVPIKHGATVVLIGAETGKDPGRLAALIAEKQITSWYSTPSVLSLLAQYGRLEAHDYAALSRVLFAGEVFPAKHLRALQRLLPGPRYFNLYGPTETNVCTYFPIPDHIPPDQVRPFPIGRVCSHFEALVADEHGHAVPAGEEGELCIHGAGVMQGYWNLPERTAQAFLVDAQGRRWYRTGDRVVEVGGGILDYVGRRDRMVKKRGYRVELGEIEAGLYRHPAVREAAVIAVLDEEAGVRVKAYVSCKAVARRPSHIELKRHCAENLPVYMVPDQFVFREDLPKTSTDKIDYQELKAAAD
jgi:amino acid adenylation domain-containing protein